MENFEILELQVGLLSPNQDPFLPPFSSSPLPELTTPICSPNLHLLPSPLFPLLTQGP